MPRVPVPPDVDAFLARPNPAVVATVSPEGAPHTAATWYIWENGRVLVNMDEDRKRLQFMRDDPRVSITMLGEDEWYRQITLRGRVEATFLRGKKVFEAGRFANSPKGRTILRTGNGV